MQVYATLLLTLTWADSFILSSREKWEDKGSGSFD